MAKKKKATVKSANRKRSIPAQSIATVVFAVLATSIAILFLLKPQYFKSAARKINRILVENPQNSDIIFPENDIVGIDISTYQGDIDWQKISFRINSETKTLTKDESHPSRDIDFVFAKATEGITIKDPKYDANRKSAKGKNILFGAYHFFSVTSDAKQQAQHFIQTAKLQKGDLTPVLDVEYQGSLSKNEIRRRVLIWLTEVKKHFGVNPIIYTYANFHDEIFDTKEFEGYYFWLAHYGVSHPRRDCKFWQFTEDGVVYGIKGYVDIDIFLGSRHELDKFKLR